MKTHLQWAAGFALLLCAGQGWSATNNTANNPTFLSMEVITNNYATLSPETIDIGVDLGADGTYDYWLSGDNSIVRDGGRAEVGPANWKRILIALDAHAGKMAKIKIVDNSASGFIAINDIRLNHADDGVVANGVLNGTFEDSTLLAGWTVLSGNLTAAQLVQTDTALAATPYGIRYFTTGANGNAGTATVESSAFELTPITSFVYGIFGGPASARFNKPGAQDSDNGLFVYVDVGTETQNPNGQYDAGTDVPLTGFYWQAADNGMEATIINTSGLEGKKAQFVAADVSLTHGISLDAIRMNWDNSIIANGGFEEGFEGGVLPAGWDGSVRAPSEHPSGGIPHWTVNKIPDLDGNPINDEEATFTYFGGPGDGWSHSERVHVGSGSYFDGSAEPTFAGIELRSDVFTIQAIPAASQSVFLSFNSAQSSTRIDQVIDPVTGEGEDNLATIQLQVDTNNNGSFEDTQDFIYRQQNQGIAWAREQFGEVDEWHYPEYRFYIAPEHQGRQGRLYVQETMTGGWAWMAVDDFYFWNGASANLAFPNSDFEMGNLTNWNEEIITTNDFTSWLSTIPANVPARASHKIMNGINSWLDGEFAADSAQDVGGSGDNAKGILWSNAFTIPTLQGTPVEDWSIME